MLGRTCTWAAVAALSLALAGCDRGAKENPNAQGSPGTGNARETAAPGAPDTPPGGPSGVKGSLPHTGSSGGDTVPGTTGRGTAEEGGRSQTAQPGSGLQGGLGGNAGMAGSAASGASAPAGIATEGSTNRTPGGATGRR
jgi:hypothetical protein